MIARAYYWFRGTPKDRKGGPWWARDFETRDAALEWLRGMPLERWAIVTENADDMPMDAPPDTMVTEGSIRDAD